MTWQNSNSRTSTPEHRAFRRAVLERDDYTCQRCGHHDPTGRTVQADHIENVANGGATDPDNGQTLCVPCHKIKVQRESAEGRAKRSRLREPLIHPALRPTTGNGHPSQR